MDNNQTNIERAGYLSNIGMIPLGKAEPYIGFFLMVIKSWQILDLVILDVNKNHLFVVGKQK